MKAGLVEGERRAVASRLLCATRGQDPLPRQRRSKSNAAQGRHFAKWCCNFRKDAAKTSTSDFVRCRACRLGCVHL